MIDDAFFAFQVRRADFDKILLDHSEDCGAAVWEETQVTDVTQVGGRVTGLRWRGPNGSEGKLQSAISSIARASPRSWASASTCGSSTRRCVTSPCPATTGALASSPRFTPT